MCQEAVLAGKDKEGRPLEIPSAWYIRVRPPQDTLKQGDPLSDGFVAGIIAVRRLDDKLKLTENELNELEHEFQYEPHSELEVDEGSGVEKAFWGLKDVEFQEKYADRGKVPSKAEFDKRAGFELVVWVRPGFRHLKVGQNLLEGFMDKLAYESTEGKVLRWALGRGGPFKLAVFFPKSGWRTSDDKFAGVAKMWLTFFSFYGFRRPGRDWPSTINDEVLVWDSDEY